MRYRYTRGSADYQREDSLGYCSGYRKENCSFQEIEGKEKAGVRPGDKEGTVLSRKLISLCLCFILIFSIVVRADEYALLNIGGQAKVLDVIDGDSIKVKMVYTGEIALVRFAGINAKGYGDAVKYLNNTILGNTVELSFDSYAPTHINARWNNMIVKHNNESLNSKLVSMGFAAVLESYNGASSGSLQYDEENAKQSGLGLWDTSTIMDNHYPEAGNIFYSGDGININTANVAAFRELMPDLPTNVINAIIYYRNSNPFNDINEIKFVPGFTKELFTKYRSLMCVCTNIASATEKELSTLGAISTTIVDRIITYREKNSFQEIDDLSKYNLIPRGLFENIKIYISLTNVTKLDISVPDVKVNINDASYDELVSTGLTSSQAERIISARSGYTYKTLGELSRISRLSFTDNDVNRFEDNLMLGASGDYVNINLALPAEMMSAGCTQDEAASLYSHRRRMYTAESIPIDVSRVEGRLSLYTNINNASSNELNSLGIAPEMVEAIMSYRYDQPFGSLSELQDLFDDTYYGGTYNGFNDIRAFISVR